MILILTINYNLIKNKYTIQHLKLENNFIKLGIDMNKDYSKIISGVNLLRLKNNPIELKKNDLKIILNN